MSRMKDIHTSDMKPKGKKKVHRKKHRHAPKRPLSAYNFFFKDQRVAIVNAVNAADNKKTEKTKGAAKSEEKVEYKVDLSDETISRLKTGDGKISFEEIGKLIGQHWKSVDPTRLAKYTEMAKQDGTRYKKEMVEFTLRQESRSQMEPRHVYSIGNKTSDDYSIAGRTFYGEASLEASRAGYQGFQAPTGSSAFPHVMPPSSYNPYGTYPYAMGQQSMYPSQFAQYGMDPRQEMTDTSTMPASHYSRAIAPPSSMYGGNISGGYGYR